MLRERVIDLLDRYESGDDWLSAGDVLDELEEILEEEKWDDELSPKFRDAIEEYVLARHYAERGGGRIPDGGDEFIERVKKIVL